MPVTFDNTGSTTGSASGSQSWSHAGSASASAVLVAVAVDASNDAATTVSVTYGGVSMSSLLRWESGGSGKSNGFIQLFGLLSPPTGTRTVAVTVSGGTFDWVSGGSLSWLGAGAFSTTVHGDPAGVVVTSGSLAVPSTSAASRVACFICAGTGPLAWTAGTSRYVINGTTSNAAGQQAGADAAGTGSNVTFSWTQGSDWYAAIGVEVQPAAAAPSGQVQPAATRQPRRAAARAVWRGTVTRTVNAAPAAGPTGSQPGGTVARRRPSWSAWGGVLGQPGQPLVSGTIQPRAAVPVPRRVPARGQWRGIRTAAVNAALPVPAGQPHGFASSRRPVGGWWGGLFTPQGNASGPAGQVQPRASVPVPRRAASRGQWRGPAVVTVNATPSTSQPGTVQPRATVPVPRRAASRGQWRGQSTPQPHLPGQAQPRATVPVPRRLSARVLWHGQSTPQPHVPGSVQPHPVIARRETARAVARWTPVTTANAAPTPPVTGTVQPSATAPHRPHAAQRVIWRGGAVPGTQPQPATGGLVRRRTAARGQWHSAAGSPPPSAPGTPVTGGTVKRRPPARGQWRGVTPAGSNAHGPDGTVQPKPVVARRTAARALWRGTVVTTANSSTAGVLFSAGTARHLWTAGEARQLWTTGRARQLWAAGHARNGSS